MNKEKTVIKYPAHVLINKCIAKMGYKSYLEIGIDAGETFNNVKAIRKVGVDPFIVDEVSKVANTFMKQAIEYQGSVIQLTSNEYFKRFHEKFDIIYVDGMHTAQQSYLDTMNAIQRLNKNGLVLVDDVSPGTWVEAQEKPIAGAKGWRGTVYEMFCDIRTRDSRYTHWGATGAIRGGQGYIIPALPLTPYLRDWPESEPITWEHFHSIRERILPKLEVDYFVENILGQIDLSQ